MNEQVQIVQMDVLNRKVLQLCFANLFLVAISGLLLRSIPVFNIGEISFVNLLHGHSHFALGGWITPVVIWMLIQYFPELKNVSHKIWRNIFMVLFFSAYGMLLSFPFQGYGMISIVFSSLSVAGTFYFAFIAWKAMQQKKGMPADLLRAAIFFLVISAIGPFATGPMKVMGLEKSVLYYDAIYFYLHFQYNGWFTFAILSILYQRMGGERHKWHRPGFYYFLVGCLLTFFLSVLWSKPHWGFNVLGAGGAMLQLFGFCLFVKDFLKSQSTYKFIRIVEGLALTAFALKLILQLVSALPYAVQLTIQDRNLVIAYLHLVMLGFVTLFVVAAVISKSPSGSTKKYLFPTTLFISVFVLSELLLALSTWYTANFQLDFHLLLFVISCGFPLSTFVFFRLTSSLNQGQPSRFLRRLKAN